MFVGLSEAFSFHYDVVPENNTKELETIAHSVPIHGHKYIYCVKHRELPIYGIQSHPDASNKSIERCLRMYNLGEMDLHSDTKYEVIFDSFFSWYLFNWTAEKLD